MYVTEIILACILGVISILLIISVLKQKGTTEGLGSILGGRLNRIFFQRPHLGAFFIIAAYIKWMLKRSKNDNRGKNN